MLPGLGRETGLHFSESALDDKRFAFRQVANLFREIEPRLKLARLIGATHDDVN